MPILQDNIPQIQLTAAEARLPAMQPVAPGDWLRTDIAYAAQLSEKARLLRERPHDVLRVLPTAEPAAQELLTEVIGELDARPGFTVTPTHVQRPDGVTVPRDASDPLRMIANLVQEDMCILQKRGDEHVLTAALLCFPSAWTLAEKIDRPLTGIHIPVPAYDESIAKRVQRLFDGVQPGRPLWRANKLRYDDPALFQPHSEAEPRRTGSPQARYLRSERQCVRRLPQTGAVVFSIHTSVVVIEG